MIRSSAFSIATATLLFAFMTDVGGEQVDTAFAVVPPSQVVRGKFVDTRELNRTYKSIKIGTQTWMAENMANRTYGSICPDMRAEPAEKIGCLYNYNGAWACPTGWHLPTDAEWTILEKSVGGAKTAGTKLKSKGGWGNEGNGTDDYGFTVRPNGYRNHDGKLYDTGAYAGFWTNTTGLAGRIWVHSFDEDNGTVSRELYDTSYRFSVRCVENNWK